MHSYVLNYHFHAVGGLLAVNNSHLLQAAHIGSENMILRPLVGGMRYLCRHAKGRVFVGGLG